MHQRVNGVTKRFSKVGWEILKYMAFIIFSVYSLTPLTWLVAAAFHPNPTYLLELPKKPTLKNFAMIFIEGDMSRWLMNSLILGTFSMIFAVATTVLAGYALSRLDFWGKDAFMSVLLIGGFMPWIARMIPTYKICISLGLIDNMVGTALVIAAGSLPSQTWIIKGFFDAVPRELEEQAWICGSTRLDTLFRVVFPLVGHGVAVVAFLSFVGGWGSFAIPLILLHSEANWPMSLGIALFMGAKEYRMDLGALTAAVLIYIVPPLVIYYVIHEHLTKVKLTKMEV